MGARLNEGRSPGAAPPASGQPILRFDNLTLGYDRHPAVHHLRGEVAAGSLLAVVGPNGGGKSTLLRGIAGELRPIDGRIELNGVSPRQIAHLTQQPTIDTSFPILVHDFVAMGLWREIGAFAGLTHALQRRVADALDTVGLGGVERRPVGALSGGQLQRALFARVILQDAPLVLLDEPYGAIDAASVEDLAELVRLWHDEGRTVIAVLHDLDHVRQHYPETLLICRELIARGDTASVLGEANLRRARQLAEASHGQVRAAICHLDPEGR